MSRTKPYSKKRKNSTVGGTAKRARFVHQLIPKGRVHSAVKYAGIAARAYKTYRGSKAKKMNQSEANQFTQISHGAAVISKCYRIGKNSGKRVKDSLGKWKYVDDYQESFSCVAGTQGHVVLCNVASYSSFVNDGGVAIDRNTISNSLFKQNPFQKTTGGGRYSAGVTPADDRIVLEKVRLHVVATNMTNTVMQGQLYICMYKSNSDDAANNIFENALNRQALGQGAITFPTSTNPAALVPGHASVQVPFVFPGEQPAFRRILKILDTIPVHLDGGSTLNMHLDFKYNQLIDLAYINEANLSYLRNLTVSCYFVAHGGQTIYDSNSGRMTLAPCKMGFAIVREIHCHATEGKRIQAYEAAPNLVTNVTDAQGKFDNIVDAVVSVASVF